MRKKANTSLQHFRANAVRQQPETMLCADSLSHVWSHRQTREVILHKHLTKKQVLQAANLAEAGFQQLFPKHLTFEKGGA